MKIELDDIALIQACIQANKSAQKELYTKYGPQLYTICRRYAMDRYEADDFMQEGMLIIFKKLHTYKATGNFKGWMRRVMVNSCLRQLQKRKLTMDIFEDQALPSRTRESNAVDLLQEEDLIGLINQLPDGYRAVFNMYVIEGYRHKEIAELLDIEESTSRSQLTKAKKYLIDMIKNVEEKEEI